MQMSNEGDDVVVLGLFLSFFHGFCIHVPRHLGSSNPPLHFIFVEILDLVDYHAVPRRPHPPLQQEQAFVAPCVSLVDVVGSS